MESLYGSDNIMESVPREVFAINICGSSVAKSSLKTSLNGDYDAIMLNYER